MTIKSLNTKAYRGMFVNTEKVVIPKWMHTYTWYSASFAITQRNRHAHSFLLNDHLCLGLLFCIATNALCNREVSFLNSYWPLCPSATSNEHVSFILPIVLVSLESVIYIWFILHSQGIFSNLSVYVHD